MKHSVQITVQQRYHRTAPHHDVLALSKILNIGRWQTRNLAGWAERSVELVRSGLPKAEIWRSGRWWIAWEIRGRWLVMAVLNCTLRVCRDTMMQTVHAISSLSSTFHLDGRNAANERKRVWIRPVSQCLSGDWHLCTVRSTFAIDAKDCDISVGGIGTKRDAYLDRPTAATLTPEERQCKLSHTSWRMGRANVLRQTASSSEHALPYIFGKFGVSCPSVRITPMFR